MDDDEMQEDYITLDDLSNGKEDCAVSLNEQDEDMGLMYLEDYSRYFIPEEDEEFHSKEDVKAWCVGKGSQHNCSIVSGSGTKTGKLECNGKGSRIQLVCSRSGVYKSHKAKDYVPKTSI